MIAAVLLVLSASIVYYPSLKVPFLLDDYGKIIRNPDIKSLDNIPSRLIYPYGPSFEFHRNDPSRPLTYLTLTLNYYFNQLRPYGYHVVNIALHVIVVLLVFILGLLVFPLVGVDGILLPFLSALIFSVHPINVNVVSYVMGRAASLVAIFYVLAVIFFIQARRGIRWSISFSLICFILALASNQLAITLPLVILVTDFCLFSGGDTRRITQNLKSHGVYWGVLAVYLGMRLAYFGKLGDAEALAQFYDRDKYFLTELVVLWKYAGMIVVPRGFSFEHLYGPLQFWTNPKITGATMLYGVLLVGLIRGLKYSWKSASLILFSVLWFFVTLSPTSSLFPTTATMAENRVYLPAVGICLVILFIVNILICKILSDGSRKLILIILFSTYTFFLGYLTFHRNMFYREPIRIWTDVIQQYPSHERAHKNLGIEYLKGGQFNRSAEEFEKALAIDPSDFDVRNNLAATYYNLGRLEDALTAYKEMVRERPNYAPAYSNMGMVYEQLKNINAAINAYQTAIRLDPMLVEPLNNLGGIYLERSRMQEAKTMFEAALRIDPHNAQILESYEKVGRK